MQNQKKNVIKKWTNEYWLKASIEIHLIYFIYMK